MEEGSKANVYNDSEECDAVPHASADAHGGVDEPSKEKAVVAGCAEEGSAQDIA